MLRFAFFIVLASLPFWNLAVNLEDLPLNYIQYARTGNIYQLCKFFCGNKTLSFHFRGSDDGLQPRIFCGLCKKKLTTMTPSTSTTTPATTSASNTTTSSSTTTSTTAASTTVTTAPTNPPPTAPTNPPPTTNPPTNPPSTTNPPTTNPPTTNPPTTTP